MPVELVNNCYFELVEEPGSRLIFASTPEGLSTSKSANLNQIEILGRSEPIKVYGSSGPRAWTVELKFFALDDVQKDVVDKTDWLESLTYPVYENGISVGLPQVNFVFGNYLNVIGVIGQCDVSLPGPWEVLDGFQIGMPLHSVVSVTFEQIQSFPLSHAEVRKGLHRRK